MRLQRGFLLLIVPLFLLLAGINGALLYVWEQAEAERGLEKQALAAAVALAAFADDPDDLILRLKEPHRAEALRRAIAQAPGLRGVYLVRSDGRSARIAGAYPMQDLGPVRRPDKPIAMSRSHGSAGRAVTSALAPAGKDAFVVAQVDAGPLMARASMLRRVLTALLLAAGALGMLLASLTARRIARELSRTSTAIKALETGAPLDKVEGFRLRETRDLALAVRLMQTSVAARLARGGHDLARRDRLRTEDRAAKIYRNGAFPPVVATVGGATIAVRALGEAPAGSFHATCSTRNHGALVIGECAADTPGEAVALALAASRFLTDHMLDGDPEARLKEACAAFAIARFDWLIWPAEAPPPEPRAAAVLDGGKAGQALEYVHRAATLEPEAVIEEIEALFPVDGLIGVVRASAEGGQR